MTTSESQRVNELYEFGPFRVDAAKETLLRAGEPVPLTPKTFQILLVLVRHGQEIVTQDRQYIITVPGRGYRLTENVHLVPEQEFAIVAASHSRVQVHVKETRPW